uniref:(northern house mosquito) hypothetical protein n=1 Tax=Culex pipiens TaxID=7175 RepID=A0A8D8I5Q7_CULPI
MQAVREGSGRGPEGAGGGQVAADGDGVQQGEGHGGAEQAGAGGNRDAAAAGAGNGGRVDALPARDPEAAGRERQAAAGAPGAEGGAGAAGFAEPGTGAEPGQEDHSQAGRGRLEQPRQSGRLDAEGKQICSGRRRSAPLVGCPAGRGNQNPQREVAPRVRRYGKESRRRFTQSARIGPGRNAQGGQAGTRPDDGTNAGSNVRDVHQLRDQAGPVPGADQRRTPKGHPAGEERRADARRAGQRGRHAGRLGGAVAAEARRSQVRGAATERANGPGRAGVGQAEEGLRAAQAERQRRAAEADGRARAGK